MFGQTFLEAVLPFALLPAAQPTATPQFSWSTVISAASLVVSVLLAVFIFLINRKNAAEDKLRASELERVNDHIIQLKNEHIAQLKNDLTDIRKDNKDLTTKLDALSSMALAHQTVCADKFVQRTSYNEDMRAHRESLTILRDTIRQQSDVIERLRE